MKQEITLLCRGPLVKKDVTSPYLWYAIRVWDSCADLSCTDVSPEVYRKRFSILSLPMETIYKQHA